MINITYEGGEKYMVEPTDGVITPDVVDTAPATPAPTAPVAPAVLPQDTRDKTREQFDKLLDSNRRLFESNETLRREIIAKEQSNRTFDPIQQVPTASKTATAVNAADFVEIDPVSGESFINTGKMNSKMDEINQRSTRAEQAIDNYIKTSEQREIERQSNETYVAYPELNPKAEKFSQGFSKQVRGVLLDSMYNPSEYGGRPLTFKEAADAVKQLTQPIPTIPKVEKKEKAQDNKAQSSAQVPSQPGNLPEPTYDADLAELRIKTRYGDDAALARRLLAAQHIVSKEGSS